MSNLRVITGPTGSGKTKKIYSEIKNRIVAGNGGNVLLVPEQYSHEAERSICTAVGDTFSRYGEVLSFSGLIHKVFSELGENVVSLDDGGRLLCMTVAMENVIDNLKMFTRRTITSNILKTLTIGIGELKHAGTTTEQLTELSKVTSPALGDKLTDLSLILEAYNTVVGRSDADTADKMMRLAELIPHSHAISLHYYIDGFTDFTKLEKDVLSTLITCGADITLYLNCEDDVENGIYEIPKRTENWFLKTAQEAKRSCVVEVCAKPETNSNIRFLADKMFEFSDSPTPENDGTVSIVSAENIYDECELAAAEIVKLAQNGSRYKNISVAVRNFEDYRIAIETAFSRYNIPVFISGENDTLQKSIPLFITSALEAVTHGYEYDAMFSYLKSGLSTISMDECDRLENYVITWDIRGSMWNKEWKMDPDGYTQKKNNDESEAILAELNDIRIRAITPLISLEQSLKEANTASAMAIALADFFQQIDLTTKLEDRVTALEASGRMEAAAECAKLWNIVCTSLEQFEAALGNMTLDPEQFTSMFSLLISSYDSNVIPVSLDSVTAGDLDRVRNRNTKHLLLLGASDDRLPRPDVSTGLFSIDERDELATLEVQIDNSDADLSREFGRIYNCITTATDSLYISYPITDASGDATRPSQVVRRAIELLGIQPVRGDLNYAKTFSESAMYGLAIQAQAGCIDMIPIAANKLFKRKGMDAELTNIVSTVNKETEPLTKETVKRLYGNDASISATKAEKFNQCPFSYFLQYGLKAKPRQKAEFDSRDYGNFMHYILEHVSRDVMAQGGFGSVTADQIGELADKYVQQYTVEVLHNFDTKGKRFEYLFRRLRTTVRKVCTDMWQELKDSKFQPLQMELDLSSVKSGIDGVSLSGRADRVDGWVKDNILYLRIIDYKTGVKKFSLSDVCQGLNLQMLLYLFALQKDGKTLFGVDEIRPAGVLYAPLRQDIINIDEEITDNDRIAELRKGLTKRSGLILDNRSVIGAMESSNEPCFIPVKFTKTGAYTKETISNLASLEKFGALSRYISETLSALTKEVRSGNVVAKPLFENSQVNACAYCEYKSACHFSPEEDEWKMKAKMTSNEAWEQICSA